MVYFTVPVKINIRKIDQIIQLFQNRGLIVMNKPMIDQVMVGKPKTFGRKDATDPMDREWTTGIIKNAVHGKVWAGKTNLQGDGQADLKHHGGPEKAIFVYPVAHYEWWQEKLQNPDFTIGAFGENLAVLHMTEKDLCVGDIFQVGEARVQVSQPRQPCWKPARRWKIKDLALQIQQEGMTGWYFRVLQEGYIQAKDEFKLLERPYPEWTVARCNEVMHDQKNDLELAARLGSCEFLAHNWQNTLRKRAEGKERHDIRKRVIGPNE